MGTSVSLGQPPKKFTTPPRRSSFTASCQTSGSPTASITTSVGFANPTIENRFPITGTETVTTWSGVFTKTAGSHLAKAGVIGVRLIAQQPGQPAGNGAPPPVVRTDISGDWAVVSNEDQPHRVPGPELGDYTGLPLNDADRQT